MRSGGVEEWSREVEERGGGGVEEWRSGVGGGGGVEEWKRSGGCGLERWRSGGVEEE